MLFRIKIMLIAMLLFSSVVNIPVYDIEPEVQPYWDRTLSIINQACGNKFKVPNHIHVNFNKLAIIGQTVLGVCMFYGNGFTISIDREYFEEYLNSYEFKYTLMAHEAAHCLLGYTHIKDPTKLMNPYIEFFTVEETDRQLKELAEQRCSR